MNKKVSLCIIAIIIVMTGVLFSLQKKIQAEQTETLKIGAILSLTGNGTAYGTPARDGMQIAVDAFNATHENKKVELLLEDSQFDPKIALSAFQSLQARGVNIFFSNGSAVATALAPAVTENKKFLFETAAVTPVFSDGKPETCRLTLTADIAGKKLAAFIADELHLDAIAFLTLNDEYGRAMLEYTKRALQTKGILTIVEESVDKKDTDVRTQITKIQSQGVAVDALVIIPTAGQAELVLKQLKELHWTKPILSDNWTIVNQNLKDLSLAEGVYFSNYDWNAKQGAEDTEPTKTFKEAYVERYQSEPPVVAANAFDSVNLLLKAYEAGVTDPEQLGPWIIKETQDDTGATGNLLFNSDCESVRNAVIEQVRQGSFVRVE